MNEEMLLLGAQTSLGEALLLRLALAGHEVTAQLPSDVDPRQTGEFAAHLAVGTVADAIAAPVGRSVTVVAASPMRVEEIAALRLDAGTVTRWVQCVPASNEDADAALAPLRDAGVPVTIVRHAPLAGALRRELAAALASPWPAEMLRLRRRLPSRLVEERDVAIAVVRALGSAAEAATVACEGQPPPPFHHLLRRVVAVERRRRWWIPLLAHAVRVAPPRSAAAPSPTTPSTP